MHKVHSLFSLPIYNSKVELNNELTLLKSMEWKEADASGTRITHNCNMLNMPQFSALKEQIDIHVETYAREVLSINERQKFHMVRSWGVKISDSSETQPHHHANSILSGVFYLQADKGCGGLAFSQYGLKLFPPVLDFSFDEMNKFNSPKWTFDVDVAKLFIFPSHIEHKAEVNGSSEDRYSIAFDYWVSGKFGSVDPGAMEYLNIR